MTFYAITREIVLVCFDDVLTIDVAGPSDVFSAADEMSGSNHYRITVAAIGTRVRTTSGISIATTRLSSIDRPIDTLLVAGGRGAQHEPIDPGLTNHVRRLARRARRIGSVCTGTFVLAEAGLIDHCRVTTHWSAAESLADRYPRVEVDPDPIYLHDRGVWTSAGATAGMDLALALVAEDLGSEVATRVARHLVISGRRSGLQSQFNPRLAVAGGDTSIAELIEYIVTHPTADLSVTSLAGRCFISERQLARRFGRAVGQPPAGFVEAVRLDHARKLLESTSADVGTVARRCGFRTRETMHRAFRKRFGVTPAAHRATFGAAT